MDELKPRLRYATDEELPEDWRGRDDQITRVFGHNAAVQKRWNDWYRPLIRDGAIPARLKEMVRLRVAQLNACDF